MALFLSNFEEDAPTKCKALWGVNERLLFDCASPCGPVDDPTLLGYFHLTTFNCEQTPPNPQGFYFEYTYLNQVGKKVIFSSLTEPVIQLITDDTPECSPLIYGFSDNKTVFSYTEITLGTIQERSECGRFQRISVVQKDIEDRNYFG